MNNNNNAGKNLFLFERIFFIPFCLYIFFPAFVKWILIFQGLDIVLYLHKERNVKADKQPLLGNGKYIRSRGTCHVLCDVTQQ